MTQPTHTPTPWKVWRKNRKKWIGRDEEAHQVDCINFQVVDGKKRVVASLGSGNSKQPEIKKANAAFIVTACNSHAALVALLGEALTAHLNQQAGGEGLANAKVEIDGKVMYWAEAAALKLARAL